MQVPLVPTDGLRRSTTVPQDSSPLLDGVTNAERALDLASAYERVLPQLLAMDAESLHPLNLDIARVVTTLLGTLPKLAVLREEMSALPDFDTRLLDALDTASRALAHAHATYLVSKRKPRDRERLVAHVREHRRLLRQDVLALEQRGLLPPGSLPSLGRRRGPRHLAFDLAALCELLRAHFPRVAGRTAVTIEDLGRAARLAEELLLLLGLEARTRREPLNASEMQRRALTLALTLYHQVRRAVLYLRWNHGDADRIAPSVHARRRRRAKRD